jgi:nucleoside phosphorylase/CheY-like chemotaxis protein
VVNISVLVVDDNESKVQEIARVVENLSLGEFITVMIAKSQAEALYEMSYRSFKLLILDMNIPVRDGENAQPDGGIHVLNVIKQGQHKVPEHVLGLTAFPELQEEYSKVFGMGTWSLLIYSDGSNDWRHRLAEKVLHIVAAEDSREGAFKVDLAIITALEPIELEAVLDLPAQWKIEEVHGDDTIYHVGQIQSEANVIRLVAAAAIDMGMPPATALAMKIISQFRPRYLAMAGISGGISDKGRNIGDIIVADPCFDRNSGKSKIDDDGVSRFHPSPYALPLSPSIKAKLSLLRRDRQLLERIRSGWSGDSPAVDQLSVHIGPVGSGSDVVANSEIVKEMLGHQRKLLGIEMEAYGVYTAGRYATEPKPTVFSAKSICDFADEGKGDHWQRYAAYTSSRFLEAFALAFL